MTRQPNEQRRIKNEQRNAVTADRLWDVPADGASIQLKIAPKTKISLKKQAKP